jgi:hypothetical protein
MKDWGMKDWDDGVGAPRDRDSRDVAAGGWVGDLLRAEAARHQPDRDRILAAIVERKRADGEVPGTVSTLDGRRRPQVSRRACDLDDARDVRGGARFAWPMVAASVAVLTMATVAGARALAPDASPDTTTTVSPVLPGTSTLGPADNDRGFPDPRRFGDTHRTRDVLARNRVGRRLADLDHHDAAGRFPLPRDRGADLPDR